MIEATEMQPPEWGTEMWKLSSNRGPLFEFGYTSLSLISNEVYLYLRLLQPPTKSEFRSLRLLFWKWAKGSSVVVTVGDKRSERFAKFFGLQDSGHITIDGKLFVGEF